MSQIMIRLPDDDAAKIRVIAAAHKSSMNAFILSLIRKEIETWEKKHGVVPTVSASDMEK